MLSSSSNNSSNVGDSSIAAQKGMPAMSADGSVVVAASTPPSNLITTKPDGNTAVSADTAQCDTAVTATDSSKVISNTAVSLWHDFTEISAAVPADVAQSDDVLLVSADSGNIINSSMDFYVNAHCAENSATDITAGATDQQKDSDTLASVNKGTFSSSYKVITAVETASHDDHDAPDIIPHRDQGVVPAAPAERVSGINASNTTTAAATATAAAAAGPETQASAAAAVTPTTVVVSDAVFENGSYAAAAPESPTAAAAAAATAAITPPTLFSIASLRSGSSPAAAAAASPPAVTSSTPFSGALVRRGSTPAARTAAAAATAATPFADGLMRSESNPAAAAVTAAGAAAAAAVTPTTALSEPLQRASSVSEKVSGMLHELRAALAEAQHRHKGELPASVRSNILASAQASMAHSIHALTEVTAAAALATADNESGSSSMAVAETGKAAAADEKCESWLTPVGREAGRADMDPIAEDAQVLSADEQLLLAAIAQPLGFHESKPLAALIIFRSCLNWGVLEARRTRIFEHITQVVVKQIDAEHDDNWQLAYWLANTLTLLQLLQSNTRAISMNGNKSAVRRPPRSSRGWLWPLTGGTSSSAGVNILLPVDARAPALRFMQQLDVLVQKIFSMIRDNVKKQIMPLLWEAHGANPTSQQDTHHGGSSSSSFTFAARSSRSSIDFGSSSSFSAGPRSSSSFAFGTRSSSSSNPAFAARSSSSFTAAGRSSSSSGGGLTIGGNSSSNIAAVATGSSFFTAGPDSSSNSFTAAPPGGSSNPTFGARSSSSGLAFGGRSSSNFAAVAVSGSSFTSGPGSSRSSIDFGSSSSFSAGPRSSSSFAFGTRSNSSSNPAFAARSSSNFTAAGRSSSSSGGGLTTGGNSSSNIAAVATGSSFFTAGPDSSSNSFTAAPPGGSSNPTFGARSSSNFAAVAASGSSFTSGPGSSSSIPIGIAGSSSSRRPSNDASSSSNFAFSAPSSRKLYIDPGSSSYSAFGIPSSSSTRRLDIDTGSSSSFAFGARSSSSFTTGGGSSSGGFALGPRSNSSFSAAAGGSSSGNGRRTSRDYSGIAATAAAAAAAAATAALNVLRPAATLPADKAADSSTECTVEWLDMLSLLGELLYQLQSNQAPPLVVQTLFQQLFWFVNVQLFNQLMLRRECCTFSSAQCLQAGLSEVESFIQQHTQQLGSCVEELLHTRQAVTLLLAQAKPRMSVEALQKLCPLLHVQQLFRLCHMYSDETGSCQGVTQEVLVALKQAMVAAPRTVSESFLLHEGSKQFCCSTNSMLDQLDDADLYSALTVPDQLVQPDGSSTFEFLEAALHPTQG